MTKNTLRARFRTAKNNDSDNTSSERNVIKIAQFALRHAAEKRLTQVASSLTFTTVLALVPLLAVVLSLFTAFPLFGEFRLALEDFLTTNLMPPAVSTNVMEYLNQFAAKASRLTAIGSLALIVTSIMLLRTIDETFNNIWQVKQQRPMRQRILVYWAIISLGPILMGASLWASSTLAQRSANYVEGLPIEMGFALTLAPLLATTLGFTALFMMVPNRRVHWKDALTGGFATALVLSLMRTGFAFYLSRFPSYTIIYGAFATLPIFLLWIYMSWLAVLSGATMAATLPAIWQRHWNLQHYAGARFVDAMTVLACLWKPSNSASPGWTAAELATSTTRQSNDLNDILATLRDLGYVVNSDDRNAEIWVLACDPRTAQLAPLVDALLIDTKQPHLLQCTGLRPAVAHILQNEDVKLETLFDHPERLS